MVDANTVLIPNKGLPDMVFQAEYTHFFVTDFSWMFTEDFYELLNEVLKIVKVDAKIEVLKPNAEWYKSEGMPYNFELNSTNYHLYPGIMLVEEDNSIESPWYTGKTFLITACDASWTIYGERSYEVIIFAAKSAHVMGIFKNIFEDYVYDLSEEDYGPVTNNIIQTYASRTS